MIREMLRCHVCCALKKKKLPQKTRKTNTKRTKIIFAKKYKENTANLRTPNGAICHITLSPFRQITLMLAISQHSQKVHKSALLEAKKKEKFLEREHESRSVFPMNHIDLLISQFLIKYEEKAVL
jgi:hypothetical protein